MALEQEPGNLDLSLVAGDDLIFQLNIPFSISGYSWIVTLHNYNGGTTNIPNVPTVATSTGILQCSFLASTTTLLATTSAGKKHSWKVKYTDDTSLTRTFITGIVSVS